jgi:Chitobiase/beta-hexosaminidase C-terminal domain
MKSAAQSRPNPAPLALSDRSVPSPSSFWNANFKVMKIKIFTLFVSLLLLPLAGLAKPTRVPSFGPNGTHWPDLIPTPFMYDDTVSNIVQVPCTWAAIKTAIQAVTTNQANSGTLILVAPGTLVGNGNGSGATPVLEDIGSAAWGQRVTVAPRDGYGSVKWSGGVRFLRVFGVCFAGFESIGESGVKLQGCRRSALAWIKCTGHFGVYGTSGIVTEGVELVEVVQPNYYVSNSDSADIFAGGGNIDGWRFDGCYHAPRFYEVPYTGGKPHTDTFQFAAASGGSYSNMTLRDGTYFSSNNCSIQTGNVDGLNLDHTYVVSGSASLSRYPHLPGSATEGTSNAMNGSGKNFTAKDSVIIGGMAINTTDAPRPWTSVQNTRVNKTYGSSNQPLAGSWTVDASLNENNSGMPSIPTDSYLNTIWDNPGATTDVSRPVFIPAAGTFGGPQQVTMTCSTANATIYYTLNGTTPTTASSRYTGPITVSATTTVRAFATASGLDASPVEDGEFRIVNQVSKPVISPAGGLFSSPQQVTLSTSSSGAALRYTLDGSTPTATSPLYSGPITISASSTLKVAGFKSGSDVSEVAIATFGIGQSYEGSEAWANVIIPTQTGRFTMRWNSIPNGTAIDGVTGLAFADAEKYDDLACIVRFASTGVIDVRNGGAYQAMVAMPYTSGVMYLFELDVDLVTKKYSVTVTPNGSTPVQLAKDYSFRTQQATVSSLNYLALVTLTGGSHLVSDVSFGTSAPPSQPQGLRVITSP